MVTQLIPPNREPVVSFVIVTWNTLELTTAAVESILRHETSIPFEIVVVDNASSDGTVGFLGSKYPQVRMLENRENLGFAQANNIGVEAAKGEFVLLMNSDAYLVEEILPECLRFFSQMPGAGMLALKLMNADRTLQPGVFPFPTLVSQFKEILGTTSESVKKSSRWQQGLNRELNRVDWVTGAFIMVRKGDYLKIGGMEESIFMYGEDMDFCRKGLAQGIVSYYAPGKSLVHIGGGSVGGSTERSLFLTDFGRLAYWKKWHGSLQTLTLRKIYILRSLLRGMVLVAGWPIHRHTRMLEKGMTHFRHICKLIGTWGG